MGAKWYVEHCNAYHERGGFADVSEPFDTETEAREYAETLHDDAIALYKIEENRFVRVDEYHAEETWHNLAGWESAITEAQLAEHVAKIPARLEENARRWDEKLREMARREQPKEGMYVDGGYFYTYQDYEKIAAYRAEYAAEKAAE